MLPALSAKRRGYMFFMFLCRLWLKKYLIIWWCQSGHELCQPQCFAWIASPSNSPPITWESTRSTHIYDKKMEKQIRESKSTGKESTFTWFGWQSIGWIHIVVMTIIIITFIMPIIATILTLIIITKDKVRIILGIIWSVFPVQPCVDNNSQGPR